MSDGLVIMLIGMGVVFLFLIILMAFIRIVAISRKGPRDEVGRNGSSGSGQKKHNLVSSGDMDEEIATVAAVAVALEFSQSGGTIVRVDSNRQPNNIWSQSGRQALFSGPKVIAQALKAHRGRN